MICSFCGNVTENKRAVGLYMRAARITHIDCPECGCALSMREIRAAVREQRYNHNHDSKGRFCSGSGSGGSDQALDKSPESGIIESGSTNSTGSDFITYRKIANVYTGVRSEEPLTAQEKEMILDYFKKMNVDTDYVIFSDSQRTVYNEKYQSFVIGTDVKPNANPMQGTRYANQRISIKGAVAHEVIGHHEAHIKGWTQHNDIYEEVQASIRAARFAPDLSKTERIALLRDARARLGSKERLRDIKGILHIEEE